MPAVKPKHYKFRDLEGQKFGRLTVKEFLGMRRAANRATRALWRCECECGNSKDAIGSDLIVGDCQSCGCLHAERASSASKTHGRSRTSEYEIWCGIIRRCENQKCHNFSSYGGRGIRMCDRWRKSFAAFLADMGPRPSGQTVERIDNDGNYEPSNCRWATRSEQAWNKRNTVRITHNGETLGLGEWAARLGIPPKTLWFRITNWTVERALTQPLRVYPKEVEC